MLTRKRILQLFRALDSELGKSDVVGEVVLCGGAVMCLVFQAREATKDVDAVFVPTKELRRAAKKVAARFGLAEDWLNDAAKGFFGAEPPREAVFERPNLRVYAPRADYMLAMKCVAARFDTHDKEDVVVLLDYLGLRKPEDVFVVIEKYYPAHAIPSKARFLVEELLG